ncbi:craniofacial development protein 1-like isoform X1 [Sinocyclocheilus rhinocerous]|uniref:craniofacial development protein 1-like isoform X1 n=1 Tax=Sinocyclocheilus rhinocerous TaxID=307959 RepID=UPI0007B7B6DD|nr:PREDICTED: craniofacial development protein 1-like isoform X1 [Sinocyclocheilus rhinocerous]
MNYSDYDSDGYSSNEDKDYVPSDDNLSEDDMNECEKEDALEGEDNDAQQSEHVKKKKKKTKANIPMRKRKKGGLKLEEDAEGCSADQQKGEDGPKEDHFVTESKEDNEEKQKKKADDIWASFLSDVGSQPKGAAASTGSQQSTSTTGIDKPSKPPTVSQQQEDKPKESSKITITKVFDFAGEEVRVTKEVDSDSREAKSFLKEEEKVLKEKEESSEPQPSVPLSSGSSAKRPVGMGSILNRIGAKKQKMSTLEKSKMDWDAFKTEEGISDELAIHNRGKEGTRNAPRSVRANTVCKPRASCLWRQMVGWASELPEHHGIETQGGTERTCDGLCSSNAAGRMHNFL